ncbi:MAG: type II toxin-antitoxin system PemK/MazF family toxin [Limisphaerales bacterium]
MPSTTPYKRGDVVLVPFPFTDLRTAKQRPALVISPDSFNSSHDDLLVAAVTSHVPATLTSDEFAIPPSDLPACGLPKPSIIKLLKLVTLHRRLVVRRIGGLPGLTMEQVSIRIREQL